MEPSYVGGRYKICARKNVTHVVAFSNKEDSDMEVFINGDAHQRFCDYFYGMNVHSESGFLFDLEDEHLGLPVDLEHLVKIMKWTEFYKQPQPYNI